MHIFRADLPAQATAQSRCGRQRALCMISRYDKATPIGCLVLRVQQPCRMFTLCRLITQNVPLRPFTLPQLMPTRAFSQLGVAEAHHEPRMRFCLFAGSHTKVAPKHAHNGTHRFNWSALQIRSRTKARQQNAEYCRILQNALVSKQAGTALETPSKDLQFGTWHANGMPILLGYEGMLWPRPRRLSTLGRGHQHLRPLQICAPCNIMLLCFVSSAAEPGRNPHGASAGLLSYCESERERQRETEREGERFVSARGKTIRQHTLGDGEAKSVNSLCVLCSLTSVRLCSHCVLHTEGSRGHGLGHELKRSTGPGSHSHLKLSAKRHF